MWNRITNIWRKELMESLRDRKIVMQSIGIAFLIGIFYAVFNPLINANFEKKATEPVSIPTIGIEYAGEEFVDALALFDITLEAYEGDLEADITSGKVSAGLIIPANFAEDVAAEERANVRLLTNTSAGGIFGGGFSATRLELAISAYNQREAIQRVEERGVDADLLVPIELRAQDMITPEQKAGLFASFSLPILLSVLVVQGGLYIAIDVTAGEKERHTLESLLLTPATDLEILIGKLLAVFTFTSIPLILTFLGFWGASALLPESVNDGNVIAFSIIIGTILIGVPLMLLMNMVVLIVSVRTKAFKDAQSAAGPIVLVAIVPAFIVGFIPPQTDLAYLAPVYGSFAVISRVSLGQDVSALAVILAVVGSLLASAAAFVVAMRLFDRERLLYSA